MRRVVITGIGVISPLGHGIETNWKALMAGKSGIRNISSFDTTDYTCKVAGLVPQGKGPGEFDADPYMNERDRRRMDQFILFGFAAGVDAMKDAGLELSTDSEKERAGCIVSAGIGGLSSIYETSLQLKEFGPRKVSPFFIPSCIINMISGQLSIKFGLKGPNSSVVTACATGTHSIGDAARIIRCNEADVMLAGGAESTVTPLAVAGFAQARALSTHYNDTPEKASRPWDQGRDGFVMGEGAGVLVLEEYEHAKKRGAKIYAEIVGYGMSGDAYHITAPAEDGNGAFRAMKIAVEQAGLKPSDVNYVNAHGTSTPLGDMLEFNAVKRLFGAHAENNEKFAMSSTKSATGHLLGATGAVEAIYSILAITKGEVPPTLNLDNPEEATKGVNLVPFKPQKRTVNVALSNSFGFGGTNGCVVFKKV